jgi:hypothetical protein
MYKKELERIRLRRKRIHKEYKPMKIKQSKKE